MRRRAPWWWVALALVGIAVTPVLFPGSVVLDVTAAWMIAALLVVGWTTFSGPAQEISLGHALFFGGAGYVAALAQLHGGLGPLSSAALAVTGSVVLAVGLSLLTTRHRGLYFSMVTMAVQIALYRLLFLRGDIFGGEEGLTGIRPVVDDRVTLFLASAALLLSAVVGARWLMGSKVGLQLGAVGQHEDLARSLGARIGRLRMVGLASSAGIAGAGGAAWALTQGYVNPDLAGEQLSARAALLGSVGGLWSAPGAVVASLGWAALRFGLGQATQWAGPLSAALLLLFVILPSRRQTNARPTWDEWTLPTSPTTRRALGGQGLVVRGVSVRFGGLQPLKKIDFELPVGRAMGILGPNGAGKTTLLNALAGLVESDGTVEWNGRRLTRLDTSARARCGVRKTFQHAARFPDFSVWEHLQTAATCSTSPPIPGPALDSLLALCRPVRARLARDLDAGTLRLMEMAMALAAPPDLLLVDEPYAGLSDQQAEAVTAALAALKNSGVTLLIVEHRLADMLKTVDDLMLVAEGHVQRTGPADLVLADPSVKQLYLGMD